MGFERKDDLDAAYGKALFDKREEQWEHTLYNTELDILELVKRGDIEKISGRLNSVFPRHDGHLSDDPHRQAIYEFVACVTLVTRFAIEGDMQAEPAYTLSDAYIKLADRTRDVKGVHALYEKMLIDFAMWVKRAKTAESAKKKRSLPVTRCMEYIDSNTHNKISLETLGRAAGRNPAYLSVQFKEEIGVPLSTYINRQKVEEAKRLLRDKNMSISYIANVLAFSSQSYFAKIFKAVTGETPKEYRLNHFSIH
jgi:YesN/AraC family two-component response regulator